ncbi:MAG: hypothetical protein HYU66_19505 [Armatimonadetes bacterium]|nr:hypothetical protein [Armatimonadota bacterium]
MLNEAGQSGRRVGRRLLWAITLSLAVAHAEDALPSGLGLTPSGGFTLKGELYRGLVYDGTDLFGGGSGAIKVRYGQSSWFWTKPKAGLEGLLDNGREAWSFQYQSDPAKRPGLQFGFNWQKADRDYVGIESLGLTGGDLGIRMRDFRVGWKDAKTSFTYGRDNTTDPENKVSFDRELYQAAWQGVSFQSETLRIDPRSVISAQLSGKLVGGAGYSLAGRKLGDAQTGYGDLTKLAGLYDRFQGITVQRDGLALQTWDRTLAIGQGTLSDRALNATYKGLSFSQSSKKLDRRFGLLPQAGYAHWAYLLGGREDRTAVSLTQKGWGASWSTLRLYQNPGGGEGAGNIIERQDMALQVALIKNLTVSASHADTMVGNEKLWQGENGDQRTEGKDDYLEVHYNLKPHAVGYTVRTSERDTKGSHSAARSWTFDYAHASGTRVQYSQSNTNSVAGVGADAKGTVARTQSVTLATPYGVNALHERVGGTGQVPGQHDQIRYQRKFTPRFEVTGGYEGWTRMAAPQLVLAGYAGVLAAPPPRASAYDVMATLRPGKAQLTAWYRTLDWSLAADAGPFKTGEHRLVDSGVSFAQAMPGDFRVRAQFSHFGRDRSLAQERMELALGYTPKVVAGLVPLAEVGFRELRVGGGHISPSLFASASLKPYKGCSLDALLSRRQDELGDSAGAWQRYRPLDRESLRFAASQAFGKEGLANVAWTTTPMDAARALDTYTVALARDLNVGFTTPKDWLAGFQFQGQYHTYEQPSLNGAPELLRLDHAASLLYNRGTDTALSASYRLTSNHLGTARDGVSRFEVQYQQTIGLGRLTLTGFLINRADWTGVADEERERYRLGFNYAAKF